MNESIVHDGMLTLRNERWSMTLSQGQCAAIVGMAEMHNKPVASPSCSSCVHEESCKEHGVNLGPVECGDEYRAKSAQPIGDDAGGPRSEGYDAALHDCADAIRAAGVEVES